MVEDDGHGRKSGWFKETSHRTWEGLFEALEDLESGCVFRGEVDDSWTLSTSLERITPLPGRRSRSDYEDQVLREFRRKAHLHLQAHTLPSDSIEWLALLQHWGGPTRFLDFTALPYVAAYFALEEGSTKGGYSCIWAVEKRHLWLHSGRVLSKAPGSDEVHRAVGQTAGRDPQVFGKLVLSNEKACVVEVVPGKYSERLSLQQGVFLCPADVNQSFEANLMATSMPRDAIQRLHFPNTIRGRALERLRAMNITRATLMPGLEGLAQSLKQLVVEEPLEDKTRRLVNRALRGRHSKQGTER
jgi:hypothetical protein